MGKYNQLPNIMYRAILTRRCLLPRVHYNSACVRKSGSLVERWKDSRRFLAQHGSVFLVIKFGSSTPLMYLCYHMPSKFGYDDISDFTRDTLDKEWIRNLGLDVDHHLPKEGEESEPPKFMKMIIKYSPIEIPEEYLTKKFLIDLAVTWVIYEFVIAPVKWPYYFIATRYAVKG